MQGDETIKIAIAETSAIIRSGLALVLKKIPGMKILPIEVATVDSLLECLRFHKPEILFINPSFNGYFDLQKLRENFSELNIKYVALLSAMSDSAVLKLYDDSVSLYDEPDVLKGKLNRLLNVNQDKEGETGQDVLSCREKEIVTCVVKGMTNKEIADTLFLSAHTVITHRRNIARKLQIHSPAGLTIYAIVNKLVELQDIKDYL